MKRAIIFLAFMLFGISLYSQGFYPDSAHIIGYTRFHLSDPGGTRISVRDSQGWIHAVWGYSWGIPFADSSEIFYSYSADNGVSWSSMENISQTGNTVSGEPTLCIDSKDNLHCVWKQYEGSGYDNYYSKYDGTSWSIPKNITNQHQGSNTANYPSLAVDSQDNLHLVWDKELPGWGNWSICYSSCSDTVWSAPIAISDSLGDDAYPALAIDYNDVVHVVWRKHGLSGILYRSWDGVSWAWHDTLVIPGGYAYHPSMVVNSRNHPVVTCMGGFSLDTLDIYISEYNGNSWRQPFRLSDELMRSHLPSVAVDSLDNIYVVWAETHLGVKGDILYRHYDGTGWSNAANLTNDSVGSDNPKLSSIVDANGVDLIWQSECGSIDFLEVLYMGLTQAGIGEDYKFVKKGKIPWITVYPNPFSTSTIIWKLAEIQGSKKIILNIFDRSGRIIRSFESTTGHFQVGADLVPGVYFLQLNGKPAGKVVKVK